MNDIRRTKDQLIKELTALRRKAASSEKKIKEKSTLEKTCPKDFFVNAPLPYRKHAELMLEASEKRFRNALEGMQLIGVMLNRKGEMTFCNDFLLNLTGWKRKEVLGKSWFKLFLPPETRADIRKSVFLKTIETGEFPSYYQNEILTRTGKRRLIAWNNTVLKDEKGEVASVTSIGEDITERKLFDDALKESEERYRLLFHGLKDAVYVHEVSPENPGKFIAVNETACRMLGYSDEELLQMYVKDIDVPEQAENIPVVHGRLFRDGHALFETFHVAKNGRKIPVEVNITLFDLKGKQMVLSVARDITDRKQLEEALLEREEKYRLLFDAESDAVIVFDGESRKFIDVNAAAVQLYGYGRKKFLDMFLKDISAEPDKSEMSVQQILTGEIMKIPLRYHRKKDGTVFPVEVSAGVFIINKRKTVIAVVRDISERVKAEEKIKIYHQRLSELASKIALIAEDERRRFADELHDLTGQNLALAKIKLSELRDSVPDKEIQGRLDELSRLVEEAASSTRSLTFELSPPILYEIGFEATAEWLGEQILRKYNIAFHFDNDMQPKPLSDEAKVLLFVSLRELIVNVAKHSKALNATVTLRREANMLYVSVSDDGIGFDASTLDFQIMKATSFGLFSTRERVERLGGRLEIVSPPGKGTTVTMVVPLKE
jgi:PAS domain S-box-containing protein